MIAGNFHGGRIFRGGQQKPRLKDLCRGVVLNRVQTGIGLSNMKTLALIVIASLTLNSASFAAKKGSEGKKGKKAGIGKVVKGFDTNGNKAIDGDEVQKLKDAFKTNSDLKPLDRNSDGSLDDNEISAINAKLGKDGGKGKKGAKAGKKGKGKKAGKGGKKNK
jgi:hypothetical protein